MSEPVWINLRDPSEAELAAVLPARPHKIAKLRLGRPEVYERFDVATLDNHASDSSDNYMFGGFAYPVFDRNRDEVGTISIRLVVDFEKFITIQRTPERGFPEGVEMPDLDDLARRAQDKDLESGWCVCFLIEEITTRIRELLDETVKRSNVLEKALNQDQQPPPDTRKQLSILRNHFLQYQTVIEPTLGLVEKIVTDGLDMEESDAENQEVRRLFPKENEIYLYAARNDLCDCRQRTGYWLENLSMLQDNLSDYLNREQTRAGNRLTAMASIMLLPTFLVGFYGMEFNENYFPEFRWINGYLFAWSAIALITVVQTVIYWNKGWLFSKSRRPDPRSPTGMPEGSTGR